MGGRKFGERRIETTKQGFKFTRKNPDSYMEPLKASRGRNKKERRCSLSRGRNTRRSLVNATAVEGLPSTNDMLTRFYEDVEYSLAPNERLALVLDECLCYGLRKAGVKASDSQVTDFTGSIVTFMDTVKKKVKKSGLLDKVCSGHADNTIPNPKNIELSKILETYKREFKRLQEELDSWNHLAAHGLTQVKSTNECAGSNDEKISEKEEMLTGAQKEFLDGNLKYKEIAASTRKNFESLVLQIDEIHYAMKAIESLEAETKIKFEEDAHTLANDAFQGYKHVNKPKVLIQKMLQSNHQ